MSYFQILHRKIQTYPHLGMTLGKVKRLITKYNPVIWILYLVINIIICIVFQLNLSALSGKSTTILPVFTSISSASANAVLNKRSVISQIRKIIR